MELKKIIIVIDLFGNIPLLIIFILTIKASCHRIGLRKYFFMKLTNALVYRNVMLFFLCSQSVISFGQERPLLGCTEIRNGTFYYFNPKSGEQETFIRKGAMQRENIVKQRETILWDVEWLNDCVYILKYEIGRASCRERVSSPV